MMDDDPQPIGNLYKTFNLDLKQKFLTAFGSNDPADILILGIE
jgi:hypothetical protein